MTRRALAISTAVLMGAAGVTPALASDAQAKPKPIKGTWSFTDTTPDPSPDADVNGSASSHCHGKLPAAPVDVNAQPLKAASPGTLTITTSVIGDWALEVRDGKGNVIAGDDANPPASEGAVVALKKGTYSVVMCNLSGAPTATANYTFKPR